MKDKSNTEKIAELESEINILKRKMKQSELERNQVWDLLSNTTKINEALKSEINQTKKKWDELALKTDTLNGIIRGYQMKQLNIKNRYFQAYKTMLHAPNGDYKKLFSYFVDKLNSLYECPLSFEQLSKPAILPSGHTIDEDFLSDLIKSNSTDPFNREKKVKNGKFLIHLFIVV